MAHPIRRFDASAVHTASMDTGCVAAAATNGDASVFGDHTRLVAVWGRPRFTHGDLEVTAQQGIARTVALAYDQQGTQLFESLSGSFALAVLNRHTGEAILATDRIGTRPLYYAVTADTVVFGSSLDAISACPSMQSNVDPQSIYDYVSFHVVPGPRTVYAGSTRVLPGSFVSWRNGALRTQPYWSMRFVEDDEQPWPELKEKFLALLRNSVRETASHGTVGTFLSGGTDSSTIAGLLAEIVGNDVRTFSIGFDAEGYDEMHYARIAARHFRTRHHEYYVTPEDVVAAIPRIASAHDQPFGNASAVPTYYCARLAREEGVDTLLGGDGGDELFGGNDRYAKQYLYSLYSDLPDTARKKLIEPLLFLFPEKGILGLAQRYTRNACVPMPARYDNHNLLEHLGPRRVFTDEFLHEVDAAQPSELLRQAYEASNARSLINRMLALDLRFTLADNDLPKVRRSCELAGVDVQFPLLHDSLVAFSARLPPQLKLRGTRLRYFFKKALRGFLPDEVISKTKHGFGLPFGLWLQTHRELREIAMDSLSDLKQRDVIRSGFLDELMSARVAEHPAYYGTMVWVLMMLEQWFDQRKAISPPVRGSQYATS
ncbi:MAG: asparagine synthetase B family protein [Rhodospirillaceae bacterium]